MDLASRLLKLFFVSLGMFINNFVHGTVVYFYKDCMWRLHNHVRFNNKVSAITQPRYI